MNARARAIAAAAVTTLCFAAPVSDAVHAAAVPSGTQVALGTMLSPDASMSTSGDFATDTYGNPWDFSDDQDVLPIPGVGAFYSDAADVSNGILTVATRDNALIRFVQNWSQTGPIIPW